VNTFPGRRVFAVLIVAACAAVSMPSSAAVTLLGSIASQPRIPARLATCQISVDGAEFSPHVVFAQQSNPVARYTVLLAFFDKKNISVGHVDITDHGSDSYDLPQNADSMTCAIARLTLDDGSTYPATSSGNVNSGAVLIGVLGAGAIAGIAIGASHHDSTSTGTSATPTPTPSSSASPTASPTSTAATPTPTPTPVGTATPTPLPTASNTAIPSARPQLVLPRPGPRGRGN
jgi:hypothetical protein